MKRIISLFFVFIFTIFGLLSCNCNHQGTWITATEATCTMAGLELFECEVCGQQQTKTIPSRGHAWLDATCITPKKCSVCNLEEGEALGHNYTSETTKKTTCEFDGQEINTCTRCNDSYEAIIAKKGHTNTLQSSGADLCSICNTKTYTTYSTAALSVLYACLNAPKTASIKSIYSGEYTWENQNCIAVIINVTAQATAGGMSNADYVVLFNLDDGKMTFDLLGEIQDEISFCEKMYNSSSSASSKLHYLELKGKYLNQSLTLYSLMDNRSSKLEKQNISLFDDDAKDISGVFK